MNGKNIEEEKEILDTIKVVVNLDPALKHFAISDGKDGQDFTSYLKQYLNDIILHLAIPAEISLIARLDEDKSRFNMNSYQVFINDQKCRLPIPPTYLLFSWDNIPGNDNESFIEFLNRHFGIEWVKTAKIEKIYDGKTIIVSTGKNYLYIKFNNEKTNVSLKIDDGRTDEFIAKMENGELNIYLTTTAEDVTAAELAKSIARVFCQNRELCVTAPLSEKILEKWTSENGEVSLTLSKEGFHEFLSGLVRRGLNIDRGTELTEVFKEKEQTEWIRSIEETIHNLDSIAIRVFRSKSDKTLNDELFDLMQEGLFNEMGIILPKVSIDIDENLGENDFRIQLNDLRFPPILGLEPDQFLVNDTPERLSHLYLFSWDEIPGNDSGKFIDFLNKRYGVDWVKTAKIDKTDDYKTIKVTAGKNFLSISLNANKTEVNLTIDDGRNDKLIVKTENGKQNIHLNIKGRKAINPVSGKNEFTIVQNREGALDICNKADLTTWKPAEFIRLSLAAEVRRNAGFFLTTEIVDYSLSRLRAAFPVLVDTASKRFDTVTLTRILRDILDEEISIRNLRTILEALLSIKTFGQNKYISVFSDAPNSFPIIEMKKVDGDLDIVNYSNCLRISLRRYISHKYARGSDTLVVYLMDPQIESRIKSIDKQPLTDEECDRIVKAIFDEIKHLPARALIPVILTSVEVRKRLRNLIEKEFPRLTVLSYHELMPNLNIQPVARISWK